MREETPEGVFGVVTEGRTGRIIERRARMKGLKMREALETFGLQMFVRGFNQAKKLLEAKHATRDSAVVESPEPAPTQEPGADSGRSPLVDDVAAYGVVVAEEHAGPDADHLPNPYPGCT